MTRDLHPPTDLKPVPHLQAWLAGTWTPLEHPVVERATQSNQAASQAMILAVMSTEWASAQAIAVAAQTTQAHVRSVLRLRMEYHPQGPHVEKRVMAPTETEHRRRVQYRLRP